MIKPQDLHVDFTGLCPVTTNSETPRFEEKQNEGRVSFVLLHIYFCTANVKDCGMKRSLFLIVRMVQKSAGLL